MADFVQFQERWVFIDALPPEPLLFRNAKEMSKNFFDDDDYQKTINLILTKAEALSFSLPHCFISFLLGSVSKDIHGFDLGDDVFVWIEADSYLIRFLSDVNEQCFWYVRFDPYAQVSVICSFHDLEKLAEQSDGELWNFQTNDQVFTCAASFEQFIHRWYWQSSYELSRNLMLAMI